MRKTVLHIAIPLILIANLLFSQVAINLLHDAHDFHERIGQLKQSQPSIQKHGEHCKICSLDTLFNLIPNSLTQFTLLPLTDTLVVTVAVDVKATLVSFLQGRAPPVSIS